MGYRLSYQPAQIIEYFHHRRKFFRTVLTRGLLRHFPQSKDLHFLPCVIWKKGNTWEVQVLPFCSFIFILFFSDMVPNTWRIGFENSSKIHCKNKWKFRSVGNDCFYLTETAGLLKQFQLFGYSIIEEQKIHDLCVYMYLCTHTWIYVYVYVYYMGVGIENWKPEIF